MIVWCPGGNAAAAYVAMASHRQSRIGLEEGTTSSTVIQCDDDGAREGRQDVASEEGGVAETPCTADVPAAPDAPSPLPHTCHLSPMETALCRPLRLFTRLERA